MILVVMLTWISELPSLSDARSRPGCPKASVARLMSPDCSRRGLQAGDLLMEVALLLEVSGRSGCGSVRLQCGTTVASHLEEVPADGVEATIGVDPGIAPETLDQFEAC
jgi:hypothetical protein